MKTLKHLIPPSIVRAKRRIVGIVKKRTADLRTLADTFSVWRGKIPANSIAADLDSKLYHNRLESVKKCGVVCVLDGNMYHGGLTDRLRGILTSYREAKRKGLPFYIMWDKPFYLTDYLEPATFNWIMRSEELSRSRVNSKVVVADDLSDLQSLFRIRSAFHYIKPQIHLYTNADSARGEYASLYSELFRPSKQLKTCVDSHLSMLGPRYWSVSYRFMGVLGDFNDWERIKIGKDEQMLLIEKSAAALRNIIRMAPEGIRILVASDSSRFLDYVKDIDARIYIVSGEIRHIDLDEDKDSSIWLKTFVDQQLIMNAEKVFRMLNPLTYTTGFPRFAAEIGGAELIDYRY